MTRYDDHSDFESPDLPAPPDSAERLQRGTIFLFQGIMAVEFVFILLDEQWMNAFLVLLIMGVVLTPVLISRRLHVRIPPEFLILAVTFIFAALFLGEIRSYYRRIWWWDILLHTSSGLLLGSMGFLLVYELNEHRHVQLRMNPGFVALFAFMFAVGVGALWECFEFGMDRFFGMDMQKAMFNDPSGLTDTMWDMIVNTLGALVVSLLGWMAIRRRGSTYLERRLQQYAENRE